MSEIAIYEKEPHPLRMALADVYSTAGLVTPTFTDGSVVAGVTPIRVVHLSELLEAVVALEAQP